MEVKNKLPKKEKKERICCAACGVVMLVVVVAVVMVLVEMFLYYCRTSHSVTDTHTATFVMSLLLSFDFKQKQQQ